MKKGISERAAGVVLTAGLLAAGCSHPNPLVGTWTGTSTTRQGVTIQTRLTLTADGKDTISGQLSGPKGFTRLDGDGIYTVNGNTITQTYTTLTVNSRPVPRSKGPVPEQSTFRTNGGTLTLVSACNGQTITPTRQKP